MGASAYSRLLSVRSSSERHFSDWRIASAPLWQMTVDGDFSRSLKGTSYGAHDPTCLCGLFSLFLDFKRFERIRQPRCILGNST